MLLISFNLKGYVNRLTADSDDHSCKEDDSGTERMKDQSRSGFMEELSGSLQFIPSTCQLCTHSSGP